MGPAVFRPCEVTDTLLMTQLWVLNMYLACLLRALNRKVFNKSFQSQITLTEEKLG